MCYGDEIETHDEPVMPREDGTSCFPQLTPRERQVAQALAVGYSNREIAGKLDISIKTVDTHRGHVLDKLRVRNNTELARAALRAGLVSLEMTAHEESNCITEP